MSHGIRLIHPIYLDVPMLVSFAAAIEGGMSFGAEVTTESSKKRSATGEVSANTGLSGLFSKFVDLSAQGSAAGNLTDTERSVQKEAKAHTEASVAIVLYERLRQDGGYIIEPQRIEDLDGLEPGALVEIAGTIEKNAIDSIIDYIDAITILTQMAPGGDQRVVGQKGSKRATGGGQKSDLSRMRESLNADRERTPFSNAIMRCASPANTSAIVTLRTENLRDLTLSSPWQNAPFSGREKHRLRRRRAG